MQQAAKFHPQPIDPRSPEKCPALLLPLRAKRKRGSSRAEPVLTCALSWVAELRTIAVQMPSCCRAGAGIIATRYRTRHDEDLRQLSFARMGTTISSSNTTASLRLRHRLFRFRLPPSLQVSLSSKSPRTSKSKVPMAIFLSSGSKCLCAIRGQFSMTLVLTTA
jgi:hypothetical protein